MTALDDRLTKKLAELPARVSDLIQPWAECSPLRTAIVDSDGAWTYGELATNVAKARDWLAAEGVRPGDRVMVISENCRAAVAAFLALSALDAWAVMVNAKLADREIDEIRDHCGARRILYTTSISRAARTHAARHGALDVAAPGLGLSAIGSLAENVEPEPVEQDAAKQVAVLVYTSGSTGRPKGVMLTHRNLMFTAAVAEAIRCLSPEDRLCGVLPISHIVGLSSILLATLMAGASLYLSPRFNPAELLLAFERDRLTILLGAPSLYALILDYAKRKGITRLTGGALRIISCSGAPLDRAVMAAAESLFGLPLHHAYGITECGPTIAQIRPPEHRDDCSVGPLIPGVEAKLMGADGMPVAEGDTGELWVRGPNIMKGYYHDPVETAAAIDPDGWFNTRDLVRFQGDHLFIVGRTKDMIIRFGFNVYPPEVEAVLNAHPAVRQSAVVGRACADGNEEIVAFAEPVPGMSATPIELQDHAARLLAAYKLPSRIVIMPSLPTTPNGKILRRELASLASRVE